MKTVNVEFGCKPLVTNQQVIDRLNELETIIYSSTYLVINQTSPSHTVIQKTGRLLILCDTTANPINIKLPKAHKNNTIIDIKKISSDANAVTITANPGEFVEDASSIQILVQDVSLELASDNNINWSII